MCEDTFQTIPEWAQFSQGHRRKRQKKPWKIDQKIAKKILFHYSPAPKILKAFLKTFPTKLRPTRCPAKEKNEERKEKVKLKTAVSLFNPNFAFCTCRNFARWYFASGSEGREVHDLYCCLLHSTSFKMCFSAKSPGTNGLNYFFYQIPYLAVLQWFMSTLYLAHLVFSGLSMLSQLRPHLFWVPTKMYTHKHTCHKKKKTGKYLFI